MKVHIHPKYINDESFCQAIRDIPDSRYKQEDVFCDNRNVVYKTYIAGKCLVVKKFKRPTIANCVIYTFFRKNKAQRAFENAEMLLSNGAETAFPVAYICQKKMGFFHTGYFISEYLPYPSLMETYRSSTGKEEHRKLINDYMEFTLWLHQMGILPKDNNPSNTLVHKENGDYRFALIDINRIETGKVPCMEKAMRSFEQLGIDLRGMVETLPQYTERRGFKLEDCVLFILKYRHVAHAITYMKRTLKRIFLHKKYDTSEATVS